MDDDETTGRAGVWGEVCSRGVNRGPLCNVLGVGVVMVVPLEKRVGENEVAVRVGKGSSPFFAAIWFLICQIFSNTYFRLWIDQNFILNINFIC